MACVFLCRSGLRLAFLYDPPLGRQADHLPADKIAGQQVGVQPQELLNIRAVARRDFIQRVAFLKAIDRAAVLAKPPIPARRHTEHIAGAQRRQPDILIVFAQEPTGQDRPSPTGTHRISPTSR